MLLGLAIIGVFCATCDGNAALPFPGMKAHPFGAGQAEAEPPGPEQRSAAQRAAAPVAAGPLAADDSMPVIRPQLIYRHAPDYPPAALREGLTGWVTLKFQLTPEGAPFNPQVHNASNPLFEAGSLAAVLKCKYAAAPAGSNLYGGRWFYLRYWFQMEGDPMPPGGQRPDVQGWRTD